MFAHPCMLAICKVCSIIEVLILRMSFAFLGGNKGGAFKIDAQSGLVTTATVIDFDKEARYTLTVQAEDQGNVGMRKKGTATLQITVLDYNDNSPVFVNVPDVVYVDENAPKNTLVFTANATDKDKLENGKVVYNIANLGALPFIIEAFSGRIRTTENFDYETGRKSWMMKVRASDWGKPYRREAEVKITVKLRDINDNIPKFEKTKCNGYVLHQASLGTEVVTLSAIDFDERDAVSYRIEDGNADGCFTVGEHTGILTVNCSLQNVGDSTQIIQLVATDGKHDSIPENVKVDIVHSDPSHSLAGGFAKVDCVDAGVRAEFEAMVAKSHAANADESIDDDETLPDRYIVNRNSPVFKSDVPDSINVSEGVAVGAKIMDVSAIDNDLGYNGKLVYVISSGNTGGCFAVISDTGILTVLSPLDRERIPQYELNVTVSDLGTPARSAWKLITINVLDINDWAPQFDRHVYEAMISESVINGTAIIRVSAMDKDLGKNSAITYSFVTETEDFAVGETTGEIVVKRQLDRERQEKYELHVRAVDGSETNPLSSEALVVITLIDINDNKPQFYMDLYSVKVREDMPVGTVVTTVSAHDPDSGNYGSVRYSIQWGDTETFAIDQVTGTIRIKHLLDFEEIQIYNMTVCATDRGRPPLSSCVQVIIEVVDVNENVHGPDFLDFVLTGSVRENEPAGTVVMVVTATDKDNPNDSAAVVYSIRDGSGIGRFTIDKKGKPLSC